MALGARTSQFVRAVLLGSMLAACSRGGQAAQSRAADAPRDLVVTVNGIPITEADLRAESRGGHQGDGAARVAASVDTVIRDELAAQRAAELGLDADPKYRAELRQLEAQVAAFRRGKLSDAYYAKELAKKATVTDAEARKYFDDNAVRIRTEIHVWQILLRDEVEIEQAARDLAAGTPFEEVAGRRFAKLADTSARPWDLGYLRWNQLPEVWRDVVYGLDQGQTSGVLRGANGRFWIVRVVAKRENQAITYESQQTTIVELLKAAKVESLREQADRDLRARAQVIYAKPQGR